MRKRDEVAVWLANKVLLLSSKEYRGLLTSVVIAGTVVHEHEYLASLVERQIAVDKGETV